MAFDLSHSAKNSLYVLSFFIILAFKVNVFAQTHAQISPAGFISIDCGSNGVYTDDTTGLLWVEDGEYLASGSNGHVPNNTEIPDFYANYNYQALQTFRYFSEERMKSKYCYALPLTTNNVSFLIRAMFLHGNAPELQLPIQFDVYINASFWMEVNFTDTDELNYAKVRESILFIPPGGNITYICLVPKQGVPFISSLELRQFDSEGLTYTKSFVDNKELIFTKSVRFTYALFDEYFWRYPVDSYDRIWEPYGFGGPEYIFSISKSWKNIGPDVNSVPSKVMESAWIYPNPMATVLRFNLTRVEPGSFTYCIFYFATNTTVPTTQQIKLDATVLPSFSITSTPSQQSYFHVLNENLMSMTFLTPYPILNAMEVYVADSILQQTTDRIHVSVVNFIKRTLNMTIWQGDPCTPVPYDWIGCYLEYKGFSWLVDTLTLSHLKDVSGLTLLDSTAWEGENQQTLNYMSITDSNVDTALFKSLLKTFVQPAWLISLNMSSNNISVFPDSQWWFNAVNSSDGLPKNLTSLDLSYNKLTQIPCFKDIPYFSNLQTLNISNNLITEEFPDSEYFSNLPFLEVLILSDNSLLGTIPSSLSIQNLPSLQVLDISNNKFSGTFPSNFFFKDGNSSFELLYANNNELSGVLDLNQWYRNLKLASENIPGIRESLNSTNHNQTYSQFFSFLNNRINGIDPDVKAFEPLIANLLQREDFNESGIRLAENPYCGSRKHFTQRYLCRISTENVNGDVKGKSRKAIIIGSALGGGFLLLCFTFLAFVIWKLSRKVYRMRMVEQELANRKVQPPYYSLAELKAATANFHGNNFLGRGSFGVVYKGVLPDGTTIAVKRLYNGNNKMQVLNDFLNEVVLITGIKHKNLIQLKGCCIESEERILVYAFAEMQKEDALWDFGSAKGFLEDVDEQVTQMICGTRYGYNQVSSKDCYASNFVLSLGYFAPEYYAQGIITTKVDVFSFGVLALEIVSGRKNFNPHLPPEEMQLLPWALNLQRSGSALKLLDPALEQLEYSEPEVLKLINIALMCVDNDPELRPAMSKVETMLMEDKDRMYDILSSAFLKRGEQNLSMDKVWKNLMQDRKAVSQSSTPGSSAKGSSLAPVSEEFPLLKQNMVGR